MERSRDVVARELVELGYSKNAIATTLDDRRRWVLDEYRAGETLRLESIEVTITVDDVYTDALGAIIDT